MLRGLKLAIDRSKAQARYHHEILTNPFRPVNRSILGPIGPDTNVSKPPSSDSDTAASPSGSDANEDVRSSPAAVAPPSYTEYEPRRVTKKARTGSSSGARPSTSRRVPNQAAPIRSQQPPPGQETRQPERPAHHDLNLPNIFRRRLGKLPRMPTPAPAVRQEPRVPLASQEWTKMMCIHDDCRGCDGATPFTEVQRAFARVHDDNRADPDVQSFNGHNVRITGKFKGTTRAALSDRLRTAGAHVVKQGCTTFGGGGISLVVRGHTKCNRVLLKSAEDRNIPVLTEDHAMKLLHVLATSIEHDDSDYVAEAIETAVENDLFQDLEECWFTDNHNRTIRRHVRKLCGIVGCHRWGQYAGGMCTNHSKLFSGTVPSTLARGRVLDEDNVIYQTAEHRYKDPRFRYKRGNKKGQCKPMMFKITRIKLRGSNDDWSYECHFYTVKPSTLTRYCVANDTDASDCSQCNTCTHLDKTRGVGFPIPSKQCTVCFPNILCIECRVLPRVTDQSWVRARSEHKNLCEGCFRRAMKNERSEDVNARQLAESGIEFSSRNRCIFSGLNGRPDGEVTSSRFNAVTWENDENGHRYETTYPRKGESERMKDFNQQRPTVMGKVWVRQDPVHLYESPEQTAQNRLVADWLKYYIVTDLGQRADGAGGKRVIVFVGFSRRNPHVLEALEEKKTGYWDVVQLIQCVD